MDLDFIRRAEKVTSFNLTTKDFQSLDYKREIQHLFNKHFFPDFNLDSTIDKVDMVKMNRLISELKQEQGGQMLAKLHSYNLKGVGPGEATLFFLCNKAQLGGGSSAGVDILVGTDKYEVKAVKVTSAAPRVASDFKLGGTVPLTDVMVKLNNLREKTKAGGTKTEMSGSVMLAMERAATFEYKEIEQTFAEIAYNNYFKNHEIIFINNAPGPRLGYIEAIKQVEKKDIMIERVTSGTIKPKVKL
jgi:hypothetical protein